MAFARPSALFILAVGLLGTPTAARQEPTAAALVARAAQYVLAFQKRLSGIVAEEIYYQDIRNAGGSQPAISQRRLRSDLLLVKPIGADRYVEFRDVFEVDGRAVRDREERLSQLFLNPPPDALNQLQRVVEESARYNIGNFTRTLNTPVLPLSFLLEQYRDRFSYRRAGTGSGDVWIVSFREHEKPSLIRTPAGVSLLSTGRYWITETTGAITRTELKIPDGEFTATIDVTYRMEPTLGLLVPEEMKELYVARRDRVEGRATYGRFRSFQVNVDESIKPIKQP